MIGFKEFHEYLMSNDRSQDSELFDECLMQMKTVTRRYAKKQIKWITNRFLGSSDRELPLMFSLDATDSTRWDRLQQRAFEIMHLWLENEPFPDSLKALTRAPKGIHQRGTHFCQRCRMTLQDSHQWEIHLASKGHKKQARNNLDFTKSDDLIDV